MKLHKRLGHWIKRNLDQLLIWSLPWKPGTILTKDNEIFVVLEIELARGRTTEHALEVLVVLN